MATMTELAVKGTPLNVNSDAFVSLPTEYCLLTSRFFKDGSSQDERATNMRIAGSEIDFDAEVHSGIARGKAPRFFLSKIEKVDKPLPAAPSDASSSCLVTISSNTDRNDGGQCQQEASSEDKPSTLTATIPVTDKPLPFPPAPWDLAESSPEPTSAALSAHKSPSRTDSDVPKLKTRPSFATLRSKSSKLFRNNPSDSEMPSSPPVPSVPAEIPPAKPRRPVISPLSSLPTLRTMNPQPLSISRPTLTPQFSNSFILPLHITLPFTKPSGPAPPRPPRPNSLDEETLTFMRCAARTGFTTSSRVNLSTATCSTPCSHTSSIETRLGLPTGHGTPRSYSAESSPLAARFYMDTSHMWDSAGSGGGGIFPWFSEYVRGQQQQGKGTDIIYAEDRDFGPIEMYDERKEGEWVLEKRVSQESKGDLGMLFRDRCGGWHFVADV